jgi:heme/copper-type cytochrome/quinol oxidase subunit 2
MNKNSSNIIKEVLLAFAMGIIFLVVLIALIYIIFPNQMTEGENTEELLLIGFPMLIAYITYYARKILNKIK